jgi:hypothetical protein
MPSFDPATLCRDGCTDRAGDAPRQVAHREGAMTIELLVGVAFILIFVMVLESAT